MKQRFKLITDVFLPIIKNDRILLLKRKNTGFADGMYSFIAGHIEENEPLTQAIIRESMEEAGITIEPEDLQLIHIMHRSSKDHDDERIGFFFTVNTWNGNIVNNEPHKCSELKWFPLNNLPANIIPYIKEAIVNIQSKKLYSEFGWES